MTRINISFDPILHKKIRLYCLKQDITLQQFITMVLNDNKTRPLGATTQRSCVYKKCLAFLCMPALKGGVLRSSHIIGEFWDEKFRTKVRGFKPPLEILRNFP